MKEFKQRRRLERIVFSRFTFLLLFALVVSLVFPVIKAYKKSKDAAMKSNAVLEEVVEINTKKDNLKANINRLNTPLGVEEELRGKFQIKKPGEEFVVIIEDDTVEPVDTQSNPEDAGLWNTTRNFVRSLLEF